VPPGSEFTTRPELAGTFGMVASTRWLASAATPLSRPSAAPSPAHTGL